MTDTPDTLDVLAARPRGFRPQMMAASKDWFKIVNMGGGEPATVYIYDEIGWGVTAEEFVQALAAVDAPRLDVHISSPGGAVFDAIAIYQALRNTKAYVTTYVDSLAASAASFISMAGDRRIIAPNGTMMVHDASGLCIGNAADMAEMTDMLARMSDNIASIYATRAGGNVADWRTAMQAETWYTAEEAVAAGLMHEVQADTAKPDPAAPAVSNAWDLSVFAYAGRDKAPAPQIFTPTNTSTTGPADGPDIPKPSTTTAPAAEPDPSTPDKEIPVLTLNASTRQWLGLTDSADDTTTDAAIAARQNELDEATKAAAAAQAKVAELEAALAAQTASQSSADEKVDQLTELVENMGRQLASINAEKNAATKDSVIDAAFRAGKFTANERGAWEARYDKAPDVTTDVLNVIPAGAVIPVNAIGTMGDAEPGMDDDFDAMMATLNGPLAGKQV